MAQPTQNGIIKFLFKAIVLPIIVIILILTVGIVVLGNMTPAQLNLADFEFGEGVSLRSLGLADMKIFEIIKMVRSLFKEPNYSDIVTNPPNSAKDGPILEGNFAGGSAIKEDGSIDYLALLEDKIIYEEEYLLEYNDTTIAHLINKIIEAGVEKVQEEGDGGDDSLKAFNELAAKVEELTIASGTSEKTMRFVISINIKELLDKAIAEANNPAIEFALKAVPNKVYMVSRQSVEVDENGKMEFTSISLKINDQDNEISRIIFDLLSGMMGEGSEGAETAEGGINKGFGEIVASVVENLGMVGTANFDPATRKVTGNKEIGIGGVKAGKITVITYTASDSEE